MRVIRIVDAVKEIRTLDPGIGYYKLWLMIKRMFLSDWVPGRDAFLHLLQDAVIHLSDAPFSRDHGSEGESSPPPPFRSVSESTGSGSVSTGSDEVSIGSVSGTLSDSVEAGSGASVSLDAGGGGVGV